MSDTRSAPDKVERARRLLYPEVAAGGFSRVDGTVHFYQRVDALVDRNAAVLDIGAGRGRTHLDDAGSYRARLSNFKGRAGRVIGVDIDPVVVGNPSLDEAHVIRDNAFPLADASVDLALCDYTFEHVAEPRPFTSEIYRVLKPGGWLCARTPNRHGYISLAARLIPDRLHAAVLRRAQPHRKSEDVFPTAYRLNTPADLKRHFPPELWEHCVYTHEAEPAYFGSSVFMWRLASAVFSVLPSRFSSTLMIFLRKR